MIQVKAIGDKVFIIKSPGEPGEDRFSLEVRDALVLLNSTEALREAIMSASIVDKEARRKKIEELKLEIKKLEALDAPIPNPSAPATLVGRPVLREGR